MSEPQPDLRERVTAVTRDVVVNVAANVIAGAVAYLVGAATGIFHRNDTLERVCAVAAVLGAVMAALLLAAARKQDRVTYLIIAGTLLGPAAVAVAAFFAFTLWLRAGLFLTGVTLTYAGYYWLRKA